MVDTSVYGKDERCEFGIYGEPHRADETPENGIEVGMEVAVLIQMDKAPYIGEGIESKLPHLGETGSAVDCSPNVGLADVWIAGAAGHIDDE